VPGGKQSFGLEIMKPTRKKYITDQIENVTPAGVKRLGYSLEPVR
jgi:hypothetical protein